MEKEKEVTDLVPVSETEVMEFKEQSKVDWKGLLKHLEIQKEAFLQMRKISFKMTRPADWVLIDGKPYLQESGAQSIARMFGVSTSQPQYQKEFCEDEKGKYYIYTCNISLNCKLTAREIGVSGICSSRDKFFGVAGGELKPLGDIDEKNIKMKAFTNAMNNGIKRLLSLRNVDLDELREAGIEIKKIAAVDHKSKGAVTEASKKAVEESEKKGPSAQEYSVDQIESAQKQTERIFSAGSIEQLKMIWEDDAPKRRALPQKLLDQLVIEKDKKKDWLLKSTETAGKF